MISLENKTALITGSSRGIGQQIALGLAEKGCNLIIHGSTEHSCVKTAELLSSFPVKVDVVFGDLSEEASVHALVEQVRNLSVPVDVLYNNAGMQTSYKNDFWDQPWADWTRSFNVNVISLFTLCSAFVPSMIERDFGRVINVTSGIDGLPELAPYGASKWAVRKITDDLAVKTNQTGVRINNLDPGWLRTDLGGEYAENPVEAVLPGALIPALIENDGPNGKTYLAIENKWM